MAYLKNYEPKKCQAPGCGKPAKKEVFGRRNESYGHFCTKHGERRLKELLREEKDGF